METEIEAKFLDVGPEALRKRLSDIGAKREYAEVLMRRRTFDHPKCDFRSIGGWVRVRDEGNQITLSYKQLNDRSLHGTKEATVIVDDFDKACKLLEVLGFVQKSYQETKREKWTLGDTEITIDTWPWIPTFVEMEASTEEVIKKLGDQLGFDWKDALHGSVETVYQAVYDVTEDEIDSWDTITFTPVPDWLESKRRVL